MVRHTFNFGSFFLGLLIVGLAVAFIKYHKFFADNFGRGAASYERYKLYGLIAIGFGLLLATNLLEIFGEMLVRIIFRT